MFYKKIASHFCNYQWKLFLVVLSCAHSGAAVTYFPCTMHPSVESFCLLPLLSVCVVWSKNFWRILFLVSLSVLGQQFCFLRRPWPVSYRHGKFLWFISQFTGICYSNSLSRLLSLSLCFALLAVQCSCYWIRCGWVPPFVGMSPVRPVDDKSTY